MGKGKKGGEDMQEERPEEKEEKPRQDDDNAPETKHADEGVEHRGGEDKAEGAEGVHHSASTALVINVETMEHPEEHRDSVKDLGVDVLGVDGLKGKGGEGGEGSEPHEIIDIR